VPVELRSLPGGEGREGATRRYQLVAGFRRVAALRLLRRERVLARVHAELPDEDAWALALVQALLAEPLDRTAVAALQERLAAAGVAPWTADLLDEALVRAPVEAGLRERFLEFLGSPEVAERSDDLGLDGEQPTGDEGDLAALDGDPGKAGGDAPDGAGSGEAEDGVEMTPEELASDLTLRLYEVNEDLAVAYEAWADLPPEGRRSIVEQARWIARLLPLLERGVEGER
jgi:hypothetical protein